MIKGFSYQKMLCALGYGYTCVCWYVKVPPYSFLCQSRYTGGHDQLILSNRCRHFLLHKSSDPWTIPLSWWVPYCLRKIFMWHDTSKPSKTKNKVISKRKMCFLLSDPALSDPPWDALKRKTLDTPSLERREKDQNNRLQFPQEDYFLRRSPEIWFSKRYIERRMYLRN